MVFVVCFSQVVQNDKEPIFSVLSVYYATYISFFKGNTEYEI